MSNSWWKIILEHTKRDRLSFRQKKNHVTWTYERREFLCIERSSENEQIIWCVMTVSLKRISRRREWFEFLVFHMVRNLIGLCSQLLKCEPEASIGMLGKMVHETRRRAVSRVWLHTRAVYIIIGQEDPCMRFQGFGKMRGFCVRGAHRNAMYSYSRDFRVWTARVYNAIYARICNSVRGLEVSVCQWLFPWKFHGSYGETREHCLINSRNDVPIDLIQFSIIR